MRISRSCRQQVSSNLREKRGGDALPDRQFVPRVDPILLWYYKRSESPRSHVKLRERSEAEVLVMEHVVHRVVIKVGYLCGVEACLLGLEEVFAQFRPAHKMQVRCLSIRWLTFALRCQIQFAHSHARVVRVIRTLSIVIKVKCVSGGRKRRCNVVRTLPTLLSLIRTVTLLLQLAKFHHQIIDETVQPVQHPLRLGESRERRAHHLTPAVACGRKLVAC
mmetsp:Transcript_52058/g.86310  ORF Transcript_52058/g.86310 Transcript_52058/m.86310 type:complete len:220 (+) Transcript_52058:664-1323(+)